MHYIQVCAISHMSGQHPLWTPRGNCTRTACIWLTGPSCGKPRIIILLGQKGRNRKVELRNQPGPLSSCHLDLTKGAVEMGQWLRSGAAFPQDLRSVSRTSVTVHSHLQLQSLSGPSPFLASEAQAHTTHCAHTCMQTEHPYSRNKY